MGNRQAKTPLSPLVRWTNEAAKHLLNRRIVEVRYLSKEEAAAMGWYHRAVVIQLDNGALFWASQDDEGNDAGALFGQTSTGDAITLPVLELD